MNYTELKTNVEDICENTFTDAQHALFAQQAEQIIYNAVDLPSTRRNVTATVDQNIPYLGTPADYLSTYSMAIISDSSYQYLLSKDVSFIREAFPNPTATGVPRYYGAFDEDTFILGPTPDQAYTIELHYKGYPESIVTAGTTWLGTNFDTALLNATLVEAIRFLKGEQDTVAQYEKMYAQAIALLEREAAKVKTTTYRR
jgi:hypothetical protein